MKRIGQTGIEWALLAVIALLCGVLSFLQYRWTGELSRAEPALLRAGLNEQLRRLALDFNGQLRDSCMALLPDGKAIRELGTEEAHRVQYSQWVSSHDRLLFSRIGIAAAEKGQIRLFGIDSTGRIAPMDWPAEWENLLAAMAERVAGEGRPPNARPDSNLIEMPVFANGAPGGELEWMIFELDEDYVRNRLIPKLVAEYLNPTGETVYDATISRANIAVAQADASAGLFPSDMGAGPGRGRFSRWTISARHREGSLDAAVARARMKNLVASLLLVALLGGMAWALVKYTARSRRLSEMQFRFAAGVSHDLRTPLTAIRGAAFNVAEGVVHEPAAVKRYAKMILRNAEELTSMIENVLAFSASLNQGKEERPQVIAVGELLQHAATAMMPEIEQAGCRIEVTVAADLPSVAGDPVAVELVFRNLIGNAVRHGAGGKWIGVSAAPFGDGVDVRVSDRGPGVPEAEQQRIFEPFYRGERTRAGQVPGTGLGLSLAKNTIERYKGSIGVHNVPGGGAQFVVRFPVMREAI